MKYVCPICGYVYDEAAEGPWTDLPEGWTCPMCGTSGSDFDPEEAPAAETVPVKAEEPAEDAAAPAEETAADLTKLSAAETAALLSSLAKGCEKQYMPALADAFLRLSGWFTARAEAEESPSFSKLLELVNEDLASGYPAANDTARKSGDRGALRSLTWSEKVTRILRSLLARYEKEGDAMLEDTGVFVCTVCGFVYVGNELPAVCPVCKAPQKKFEKIGG